MEILLMLSSLIMFLLCILTGWNIIRIGNPKYDVVVTWIFLTIGITLFSILLVHSK